MNDFVKDIDSSQMVVLHLQEKQCHARTGHPHWQSLLGTWPGRRHSLSYLWTILFTSAKFLCSSLPRTLSSGPIRMCTHTPDQQTEIWFLCGSYCFIHIYYNTICCLQKMLPNCPYCSFISVSIVAGTVHLIYFTSPSLPEVLNLKLSSKILQGVCVEMLVWGSSKK